MAGAAGLFGCGRPAQEAPLELPDVPTSELRASSFGVLSYHLGEAPPPPQLAEYLSQAAPDIVALQGLARPDHFEALQSRLAESGTPYPHGALLEYPGAKSQLAVLSRHPLILRQFHTNDLYRIGETECRLEPGILDATFIVDARFLLRVYVARLLDKSFHPLGQAEMRRNEARLLAQNIGRALRDQPDLPILVACALSDVRDSAPFRELTERRSELVALDPRDAAGSAWTYRDPADETYQATDFFFASPALATQLDGEQTLVLSLSETASEATHRPLLATFRLPAAPGATPAQPAQP